MEQTMQNVINDLNITEEQFNEAKKALYDEFGYTMSFWSEDRLKQQIEDYLISNNYLTEIDD